MPKYADYEVELAVPTSPTSPTAITYCIASWGDSKAWLDDVRVDAAP